MWDIVFELTVQHSSAQPPPWAKRLLYYHHLTPCSLLLALQCHCSVGGCVPLGFHLNFFLLAHVHLRSRPLYCGIMASTRVHLLYRKSSCSTWSLTGTFTLGQDLYCMWCHCFIKSQPTLSKVTALHLSLIGTVVPLPQ